MDHAPAIQHPARYALARALTVLGERAAGVLPLWRAACGLGRGVAGWRAARAAHRAQEVMLARLVARLGWRPDDLPRADGWAGSPELLCALADLVAQHRPRVVVEFGSGLSTLVLARALVLAGGGRLISYDHNAGFADLTRARLAALGLAADVRAVELTPSDALGYPGEWYAAHDLPDGIDLLVIDGPPAWFNAGTRGGAGPAVFPRLSVGGVVLLDDADRPGERANAERWAREFPGMRFTHLAVGKGLLRGERVA